ncbi:MAG TPA: glycoside hydrolase family 2 TIM barrel-domain containing protein [Phycisphaerae bacterium]|nr:glycoside hydrolase family 2 TIM barrel-domain containing protein [Phycisphaerae bacterium]
MRRLLVPALLLLLSPLPLLAQATAPAADPRLHVPLLDNWKFYKGSAPGAEAATFADANWQSVSIPHTWNNMDGQDGGNNYFKGDGWYRRHITVDDSMKGKQLFLRFEAINRKADIYVNGTLLGSHAGGNAAICLDATKLLHPGDNLLAIKANNAVQANIDIPPLQADFTFFGGIYRPAELLAVDNFHFSLTDLASSGVYVTTPQVTEAAAKVRIRAIVESAQEGKWRDPRMRLTLKDRDGRTVANGWGELANFEKTCELTADLTVENPHLWNGRLNPYLYSLQIDLLIGLEGDTAFSRAVPHDSLTVPLGIRTMSVDPARGFLLNGKPYDLHGVNRHQDRFNKGWAISEADHLEDMALIKEMGCTAIRLAHYQHSQFFYDLCDKEGMIVWAEIPVVDKLGSNGSAFHDNAKQQYTELIRQNFNHPSIAFWSAGNEVDENGGNFNRNGPEVYGWFKAMSDLGHKEDPSRLTASAWREKFFPPAGTTDVIGLNEYLGWYTGGGPGNNSGWEGLETYIANHSDPAKGGIKGMWAVTEYGAGSSIYYHSENPKRMDHSEEYESLLHENTWKVFNKHPEIWGKFVWNMFDFAVDGRNEGDQQGRNDKGLVTYDRKTKKDAFYFYKAVWSSEPTIQITSKRFPVRGLEKIPVKVYTNAAKATLTVNGTALGEKPSDNGTIVWENVALKQGPNDVRVAATGPDGKPLTDTCTWTYTPGAPADVKLKP